MSEVDNKIKLEAKKYQTPEELEIEEKGSEWIEIKKKFCDIDMVIMCF